MRPCASRGSTTGSKSTVRAASFGTVTPENFGRPGLTDYRNPNLAEAMKVLGYVQRFGVGIPTAQRELEKNGNRGLEFSVEPTFVQMTVRERAG